ncbi:MAG TPA: ATP-binding protein [Mucilaginibacter sp.]|nr:ATP-binding protein [Mucilaginibacter sp.]
MPKTEIVNPNISNFISSLRDIGYSFEVAVADLIDNSITAQCSAINVYTVAKPSPIFCLLDNGNGMTSDELVEAMRLASKSPLDARQRDDLGRFGLGLKTASFSQSRQLTVISKKEGIISCRRWDLDFISTKNKWLLIEPETCQDTPLYENLKSLKSGTLVCWEKLDRIDKNDHSYTIDKLRKHLSLVFHKYLEGFEGRKALKIVINENQIAPFNPFNTANPYTQELFVEKIKLHGSTIKIQPFILPHHSKLTQQEYNLYATEEGYIKSQGFYLYRRNRILIYGTWWGLHKALDAHKLVRIKIDIENNIDTYWGIDIKKSIARPSEEIRNDLKRIISLATQKGSRPYTGRGKKIEDKSIIHFWTIVPINNTLRFSINREHPLYQRFQNLLSKDKLELFEYYLKGVEAYLPLDAIQYNLQANPHLIEQEIALTNEDIGELMSAIKAANLPDEYIQALLQTEIFLNRDQQDYGL